MSNEKGKLEDFVEELVKLRAMASRQKEAAEAYRKAQREAKDEGALLDALTDLNAMTAEPEQKVVAFALESAVRLTDSENGWAGALSADEKRLVRYFWSGATMDECRIKDTLHSIAVWDGGAWNRPIIERKPVIVNEFSASLPGKKGTPVGHMPIKRFLGVPVIEDGKVVAVAEVGNKSTAYDAEDVRTVSLLFSTAWKIVGRKQAEGALADANAQFEMLFDLVGKGIYSMDLVALTEIEMALGAKVQLDLLKAEDRRLLERPLQTLVTITSVIDDVKAIHRARGSLQLIGMDLGQVLTGVTEEYASLPAEQVTINYAGSQGCCVRANELLRTVFSCLIQNAIKGSSLERPLKIDMSVASLVDEGRDYYVVTLEVNGPGLCNMQSALCSESEACRGGMQYTLIKTIVGHFGGRMWVESLAPGEPEKGCRAFIMLPKAGSS